MQRGPSHSSSEGPSPKPKKSAETQHKHQMVQKVQNHQNTFTHPNCYRQARLGDFQVSECVCAHGAANHFQMNCVEYVHDVRKQAKLPAHHSSLRTPPKTFNPSLGSTASRATRLDFRLAPAAAFTPGSGNESRRLPVQQLPQAGLSVRSLHELFRLLLLQDVGRQAVRALDPARQLLSAETNTLGRQQ